MGSGILPETNILQTPDFRSVGHHALERMGFSAGLATLSACESLVHYGIAYQIVRLALPGDS